MHFELLENPVGVVMYRGGFADVLKREYCDRGVAVKALRVYDNNCWQGIANVSHYGASTPLHALVNTPAEVPHGGHNLEALRHPNILPLLGVIMTKNQFAVVSEWMTTGTSTSS